MNVKGKKGPQIALSNVKRRQTIVRKKTEIVPGLPVKASGPLKESIQVQPKPMTKLNSTELAPTEKVQGLSIGKQTSA